jgi:hypothetical protein
VRDVRVLTRVAARAALAQEIPKLIELHFKRLETLAIFRRQRSCLATFEKMMFLGDQLLDVVANLRVVH